MCTSRKKVEVPHLPHYPMKRQEVGVSLHDVNRKKSLEEDILSVVSAVWVVGFKCTEILLLDLDIYYMSRILCLSVGSMSWSDLLIRTKEEN